MDIFERLAEADHVAKEDVTLLRRIVFAGGTVREVHIRKLLSIVTEGKQWQWLLNDACRQFFLEQARPQYYFSDAATSALDVFQPSNRANPSATRALVHLLNQCRAAPPEVAELAMKNLEADVLADGKICADEIAVLRKFLYAQGSMAGMGISRQEADMMFTLNDYSNPEENDASWVDLFSKAIGNHLMVQHGYIAPEREEALRQDDWVSDTSVSPGRFMDAAAKSIVDGGMLSAMFAGFGKRDRDCVYTKRNEAFVEASQAAEAITREEAVWLAERIGPAYKMTAAHKALIAYISNLCDTDLPEILIAYQDAA